MLKPKCFTHLSWIATPHPHHLQREEFTKCPSKISERIPFALSQMRHVICDTYRRGESAFLDTVALQPELTKQCYPDLLPEGSKRDGSIR